MCSEWQPIETAPKDGTEIDLWVGERETDASWGSLDWEMDYGGAPKGTVGWRVWASGDWSCYAGISGTPTHWMPLPSPPTPEGTQP